MSHCRQTSNTVSTQVLCESKSYPCLDNKNSIVSDTLDWNYIVSNTLDRPLHRDWFNLFISNPFIKITFIHKKYFTYYVFINMYTNRPPLLFWHIHQRMKTEGYNIKASLDNRKYSLKFYSREFKYQKQQIKYKELHWV